MSETKKGISFSFSKKKEKKVLKDDRKKEETDAKLEETDYVLSIEGKEVKSTKEKEEEKELVIPLITANRWRNAKRPEELEKRNETDEKDETADVNEEKTHSVNGEEDDAVKELLQEAARRKKEWATTGKRDMGLSIPLLLQNQVPEGFETDDQLNVDLRPEEPEEADYESVPIEQYGLAMLRGMGWKKGEGIGKKNQNVKPVEAIPRPKGLGLGADRSVLLQAQGKGDKQAPGSGKDGEEKLEMKKGAYCLVTSGKHKDLYATVEGIDEDNSRLVVKLAVSRDSVTLSQFAVQLVNRKDFDKYSKYLNKSTVDKFKEEQSKKEYSSHDSGTESDRKHERRKHKKRSRSRSREKDRKHRSRSRSKERSRRKRSRERDTPEKSKPKKEKHSKSGSSNGRGTEFWLRPHLRVRMVDPEYKKGKYFKSKVIIEDVVSLDSCICRTEDGRVLEDVNQSMLETVIPRSEPGFVMVTSGKHRGELAEILQRNKSSCIATVQLLSNRDKVLEVDFDHICEYTGDVQALFDY